MQQGLSTSLGRLAVAAVLAAGAWASDGKPWAEGNDYVRLENVNAANQHPVTFSAEQLTNLLGHFFKHEQGKEPAPYFSQDEIERLSGMLVPLFAKAKAADDIEFGTSFRPGNFFLSPRQLNAGRLFVENGQLNLIVGMCADSQDLSYLQVNGSHRPLNHGSRIKPAANLGCELVAGNEAARVDNRPDWLRLNIPAALATKVVTAPHVTGSNLTFAPTAGTSPAPAATTYVPAPAPAAAAPAPAQSQQQVLPTQPTSKVEERLMLIKRLHDNGLINDVEYEQKRASILKEL